MRTKYCYDNAAPDGRLRVLVVDDSHPVRRSLCQVLRADRRFAVVGSANNGRLAVRMAARLCPDLVLMDVHMPEMDGLEATRRIKTDANAPAILIVALNDTPACRAAAKAAGADGFVSKVGLGQTLPPLLSAMHQRHRALTQASAKAKSSRMSSGKPHTLVGAELARLKSDGVLTPRERQIVQLIAEGRSSKDVAGRLKISVNTVDTHRSNLMRKLNLHSVSELVRYAIRMEIIEP